jgi:hypothetical protein
MTGIFGRRICCIYQEWFGKQKGAAQDEGTK